MQISSTDSGDKSLAQPRERLWSGRTQRIGTSQALPPDVCKKSTNGDNPVIQSREVSCTGEGSGPAEGQQSVKVFASPSALGIIPILRLEDSIWGLGR